MPVDNDVDPETNPFALALAGMPEVWQSLLIDHEPDRHNRCTACRSNNTPGVPWPCTLRVAAEDARDLAAARDRAATDDLAAARDRAATDDLAAARDRAAADDLAGPRAAADDAFATAFDHRIEVGFDTGLDDGFDAALEARFESGIDDTPSSSDPSLAVG